MTQPIFRQPLSRHLIFWMHGCLHMYMHGTIYKSSFSTPVSPCNISSLVWRTWHDGSGCWLGNEPCTNPQNKYMFSFWVIDKSSCWVLDTSILTPNGAVIMALLNVFPRKDWRRHGSFECAVVSHRSIAHTYMIWVTQTVTSDRTWNWCMRFHMALYPVA